MEPVNPPKDFLEKIHERMTPHSALNKIFRKLFVPFHIKIPLELAAATTVTILVVLVLNIQQPEISAQSYESFCTQLTGLAIFQNPPPELADIDLETFRVRLRFLSY